MVEGGSKELSESEKEEEKERREEKETGERGSFRRVMETLSSLVLKSWVELEELSKERMQQRENTREKYSDPVRTIEAQIRGKRRR